jgi:hypothetical protein
VDIAPREDLLARLVEQFCNDPAAAEAFSKEELEQLLDLDSQSAELFLKILRRFSSSET